MPETLETSCIPILPKNPTWAYAGKPIAGFEELLEKYKTTEFQSPVRSAVPFLEHWRCAAARACELSQRTGFSLSDSIQLDFEHEVQGQRRKGRPSCTDLMLSSGEVSIAIEAKYTEPRYEHVDKWLDRATSSNRAEVLDGWFDLLMRSTTAKLLADDFSDVPYQLVHRAASACSTDAQEKWLVYQVFGDSKTWELYRAELRKFAKLLGPDHSLMICLAACSANPSAHQAKLKRRWERDKHSEEIRQSVIDGLRSSRLYKPTLERVSFVT